MLSDAVIEMLEEPHSVELIVLSMQIDLDATRDEVEQALMDLEEKGLIEGYFDKSGTAMARRSNTPALTRARAANYGPRDSDACCVNCRYFVDNAFGPHEHKLVCHKLDVQVLKGDGCNHFAYREEEE